MTLNSLGPIDEAFAAQLGTAKESIVSDCVNQLGVRSISFREAPAWPELAGLPDEALIESFLVAEDGSLTALSEAPELDGWTPRAAAFVDTILTACRAHSIVIDFPAYVTASITPVALLEGNPHLDDDQLVPGAGLGLVAINGQHLGPRVAQDSIALDRPATPGPLAIPDEAFEFFRTADLPVAGEDEIAVLAQFGQLHAGPSRDDIVGSGVEAPHRQLLVFRAATQVQN